MFLIFRGEPINVPNSLTNEINNRIKECRSELTDAQQRHLFIWMVDQFDATGEIPELAEENPDIADAVVDNF